MSFIYYLEIALLIINLNFSGLKKFICTFILKKSNKFNDDKLF